MFRIIFLFNIFILLAFANVNIKAPSSFIKNERYIFSLEAYGNKIEFPKIEKIDNIYVQELESSSSTNIINGNITRSIKKTYSFKPTSSFILPSFNFLIDNKKYKTETKNIIIKNIKKTKLNFIDLSIKTNKKDLYVGESFLLTLILKFKKDAQILDLSLNEMKFDNFWYKQLNQNRRYSKNGFEIQELDFLLFPLKAGPLLIEPLSVNAQVLDIRRNSFSLFDKGSSNVKVYSNTLNFNIKPLPKNISLIGDFKIETSINKNSLKEGEALSYKLQITGNGNFEDIDDFKLDIKDVSIYENKADIKMFYENNLLKGTYSKTFSIISPKDFKIPSIEFSFFDKNNKNIKTIKSKEYFIKVNSLNKNLPKLEKETKTKEIIKIVEKTSTFTKVLYFIFGILFTLLILSLYIYVIKSQRKKEFESRTLIKNIKKTTSNNELLKVLSVYVKMDKNLDELIFSLEKKKDFYDIKKRVLKLLKNDKYKGF